MFICFQKKRAMKEKIWKHCASNDNCIPAQGSRSQVTDHCGAFCYKLMSITGYAHSRDSAVNGASNGNTWLVERVTWSQLSTGLAVQWSRDRRNIIFSDTVALIERCLGGKWKVGNVAAWSGRLLVRRLRVSDTIPTAPVGASDAFSPRRTSLGCQCESTEKFFFLLASFIEYSAFFSFNLIISLN